MDRASFLASVGIGSTGLAGCLAPQTAQAPSSWLNVRDYGAVGDGSVDDAPAIQAAFDAAAETPDGRVVHAPAGTYAVSRTIHARGHGTVVNFDGVLVPYGGFDGFLLLIDGRRRTSGRSTYAQAKLDITRLRIDGRQQSRGVRMEHVDHAFVSNVLIERTAGTAMALYVVRESDFVNLSIIEGVGSEYSLVFDQDEGDGANNLRFHGLTIGYCTGPAILIDSHTRTPSRNLFFFGAQLHYLDRDRGWGAPMMDVRFIDVRRARRIVFIASNLRMAETSGGTVLSLGTEQERVDEVRLVGCTISGEGRGATGVDIVNCGSLTMHACDFEMRNGRPIRGQAAAVTYYGAEGMALPTLDTEPQALVPGMIALAGGGSWNPAARAAGAPYLVRHERGRWSPLL